LKGVLVTPRSRSEYADLVGMFQHLKRLDEQSNEHRRQRDAIVERCLPLASHIARRFSRRGEPYEDLVQVARLGLVQAVKRFDPDNGADFLAFAIPTMMGEVRRYFRDHGWAVKVPRRMKELGLQLNRARDELFQQLGRAPTASEMANHLGLGREEVVQAQIAATAYSTVSSDWTGPRAADDIDGQSITDKIGAIDCNLDKVLDVETVRPLLAKLPARQQHVLMLRFFENMTQTQIAERLGISQMHVSRLLSRSLDQLSDQALTLEPV